MALLPDKGKMVYTEQNVDIPGFSRPSSAYDLGLYHELGGAGRAVLEVTVICSFSFDDGTASTGGAALTWTAADKTKFMDDFKDVCSKAWGEQYRIKTACTSLPFNDVGVIITIVAKEGMGKTEHSHWNLTVKKVDAFKGSATSDPILGGMFNGKMETTSRSLMPTDKGGPKLQRPAVHEFGHMLGYLDEYLNAEGKPEALEDWTTDLESVMNRGDTIRDRHYVFFAYWLTNQYTVLAGLKKEKIDWKVNGTLDRTHAKV